jgi:hypothetical protein
VKQLHSRKLVRRAFFVRYELGGPHVRLRLNCAKERLEEVRSVVKSEVMAYLKRFPSRQPLSNSRIQEINRILLATDKHETDSTIYQDNSVHEFRFRPEMRRYGGAGLIEFAYDMFTWTSLEAWASICHCTGGDKQNGLFRSLSQLFELSVMLAHDFGELRAMWTGSQAKKVNQSTTDRTVADAIGDIINNRLRTSCSHSRSRVQGDLWLSAGEQYRRRMLCTDAAVRLNISRSHVHMFANRLGISNKVERGFSELVAVLLQRDELQQFPNFFCNRGTSLVAVNRMFWRRVSGC